MKRYDRRKWILITLGIQGLNSLKVVLDELWFSFIVVEEAEVFEASKQGQEIPTPEDIPFYHDFTATADKVN